MLVSPLKAHMEKITGRFDGIEWIVCPACQVQWSKLHGCDYYEPKPGQESKRLTSYLCVECAESLKSFSWVMDHWPMDKFFDNWPDRFLRAEGMFPPGPVHSQAVEFKDWKTGEDRKDTVRYWQNFQVKFSLLPLDIHWTLRLVNGWFGAYKPLPVTDEDRLPVVKATNVVAFWFAMKQTLINIGIEKTETEEAARTKPNNFSRV